MLVSSELHLMMSVLAVALCSVRRMMKLSLWAAALLVGMMILAAAAAYHTSTTVVVGGPSAVWVHVFALPMLVHVFALPWE